jgi:hypothetical protein
MTDIEIQSTVIAKARYNGTSWEVWVIDENNFIYKVVFDGTGEETNESIINSTYTELLNVTKNTPPEPYKEKLNENVVGVTPYDKRD